MGNIKFTRPSGLREYEDDHAVFALSALLGFFVDLLHVREWTAKRENVLGVSCALSERYHQTSYEPVIIINRHVPLYEKASYYALAECCIINAVRDGMNLVPYEYIVCRQGSPTMDEALDIGSESPRTNALVISEFIACSPSLSGAIRVNPWDINAVADALNLAITMPSGEKQLRHEKHYRYVSSHDLAYWAKSFVQDLEKLNKDHAVSAYERTNCRAFFLDYDGTVLPSVVKTPSPEIINVLNILCSDPKNIVFIGKTTLSEWFDQCENLGIAAEHGYYLKWSQQSAWEMNHISTGSSWKEIVEPVMRLYTEATNGSYIETKESALVWHYYDADPDFGSWQAKQLLDHLECLFANEPVTMKKVYSGTSSPAPEIFACTVDKKSSKARYYLEDTEDVMMLLQALGTISVPKSTSPEEDSSGKTEEACFDV
ncbi:putative alpha,alpha-trehalose-phosphate synthase [UDP-forming] 9 [Glycine soja]